MDGNWNATPKSVGSNAIGRAALAWLIHLVGLENRQDFGPNNMPAIAFAQDRRNILAQPSAFRFLSPDLHLDGGAA